MNNGECILDRMLLLSSELYLPCPHKGQLGPLIRHLDGQSPWKTFSFSVRIYVHKRQVQ